VWILLHEKINGYERDDKNLGGEVEYLTAPGSTRVCLSQSSRLSIPGTEVGKITGFDSGLHFNLPGFSSTTLNPDPGCVPALGPSRGVQSLFTASQSVLGVLALLATQRHA
jgi:hypothetical protein